MLVISVRILSGGGENFEESIGPLPERCVAGMKEEKFEQGISIVLSLLSESTQSIRGRVRDVPLSLTKTASGVTVDCFVAEIFLDRYYRILTESLASA